MNFHFWPKPRKVNRASSFVEYASSRDLTPDETYTIELLIEYVRGKFDPDKWDHDTERREARQTRGYRPRFLPEHVQPAAKELAQVSWLSLQRIGEAKRPVRDLNAFRYLPKLATLVLIDNEVSDLTPLGECPLLSRLHLQRNPLRDIRPLAGCANLEELHLDNTPVKDFSALQSVPKLRDLSLSTDQIRAFKQLEKLPVLRKLKLGLDTFDSFDGFPQMPELRSIQGVHIRSLEGIQQFSKLENLVNVFGEINSLQPLHALTRLTHANLLSTSINSLAPLAGLSALREFRLTTDAATLDLRPLENLPALHKVTIKCSDAEPAGLERLCSQLPSWDVEFLSDAPRHVPSLEIQVVDQPTFDYYDTKAPFNREADSNESMLVSELEWLDDQLEEVFAVDFAKDEDYTFPFKWGGARSRTVVLLSDAAVEAFPKLVLGIQGVLSRARNDWIIYFQSDEVETEFIVWIYPGKIMVTEQYAETVRDLVAPD